VKILHVAHGYHPEGSGGVESYLRDLTAEQRRGGHDVALVAGSLQVWPQCGIETQQVDGLTVLRVHRDDQFFDHYAKAWHPGVERLLRDEFARRRPDVVHVHQWIRLTSNLVEIATELGIPAVVTLHDLFTSCPRCFRVRPDDEACFRELSVESCLDCVPRYGHESEAELRESIELHRDQFAAEVLASRAALVATAATADLIAAKTPIPRAKLQVLPLAYERRFPAAPPPAPLPRAGEPLRLGYWGNLTRRKGVHLLPEAIRRLRATRPVELHLFGACDTPKFEAELRAAAAGLPITLHGRFTREQLAGAGLHAAVFPMVCFETFGFVLDEAFELRLPCVVTGIGALPERAAGAALVVPPRDAAALAAAVDTLAADPARLDALRARIPPLPPAPAEHAARLQQVYAAAIRTPAPLAPSVPAQRRAAFLLRQRESALWRITPEGGPR
jgi:glycosyltransferase involved in cell wall biosynthesis